MATVEDTFKELAAYWRIADQMIDRASKEDMAEVAHILALQSAAYPKRFGELPLEDYSDHLRATDRELAIRRLLGTPEGASLPPSCKMEWPPSWAS